MFKSMVMGQRVIRGNTTLVACLTLKLVASLKTKLIERVSTETLDGEPLLSEPSDRVDNTAGKECKEYTE